MPTAVMDLKSGHPYWAVKNGLLHAFPKLDRDLRCDVAIIGAGITGAIIADELARAGHDLVVLEQREVAWGSTAASTALIQYEIDTPLAELAGFVGPRDAARAYLACADAVAQVGVLARDVGDAGYAPARSLYYASRRGHRRALQDEFATREAIGLDVEWLDAAALEARFGIRAGGAILSTQAARIDPYRLASRLLDRLRRRGVAVHDRTRVEHLETTSRRVVLHTGDGYRVSAAHVVVAAGYASERWLSARVARNRSTYAFVTDPQRAGTLGPLADTLVWETARPYLYLRSTPDGRLIVGGEDDAVDIPARRDRRVASKASRLCTKAGALFPHLDFAPAFAWGGTFAETADGLPFFGPHPQYGSRVQFAMAYGGNGITYAMLGAALLRANLERRRHPLRHLFGFARAAGHGAWG
jgi:glycine/D-amino acid oxidase-like deaminating enzyme